MYLTKGWDSRKKSGETLERKYVDFYKPHIKLWFQAGTLDRSKRMSVSFIRRGITALFPTRYDIPNEQQELISNLLSKEYSDNAL